MVIFDAAMSRRNAILIVTYVTKSRPAGLKATPLGLEPCQPRPWRVSLTEGDGQEHDIPDLVNRDFTAGAPGEKMVGDITYISTWGKYSEFV